MQINYSYVQDFALCMQASVVKCPALRSKNPQHLHQRVCAVERHLQKFTHDDRERRDELKLKISNVEIL
jgi:hypothetical protein